MITKNITMDEMIQALRDVVEETGPDFRYPEEWRMGEHRLCRYVLSGEPACLIGRALYRVGVPLIELQQHEGTSAESLISDVSPNHPNYHAGVVAAAAQVTQDAGHTWGDALKEAEIKYTWIKAFPDGR